MTAPVADAATPPAPGPVLPTAPADDTTTIDDDPTPLGNVPEEDAEIPIEDEEEVPLGVADEEEDDGGEVVDLEEEETPLAEFEPEAESKGKLSAWWSIIPIVAAAVAGKTGYDKKHKKGIFAEKKSEDDGKGRK